MNSNLPLFEAKPELGKWHLILQPNLPFCPGMTEKDSTSNSHLHKGAVTTVNQREGTHPVGCQLSTHYRMLDNLWREITAQLGGSWFKAFNILSGWSVVRTVRKMCLPGASPCLVRSLEKLKTMTTALGLFTMYGSLLMTWHQAAEPSCLVDDSSLPPRHGSQQTEE